MALAAKGISRQDSHEEIRVLSHEASAVVKQQGKDNDLIQRIRRTPFFAPVIDQLDDLLDSRTFIGRAPQQVERFTSGEVASALEKYSDKLQQSRTVELHV